MNCVLINSICLVILNTFIGDLVAEKLEDTFEDLSSYPPYVAIEEIQVYKIIKNYSLENNQIESIQKYILDFEESGLDLKSDWNGALEFTKSPLAILRMSRRFVNEYKSVERTLEIFNETETMKKLQKIKERNHGFLNSEDFSNVLYGLLTLQDFHDLNAKNLARGKLFETQTGIKLNRRHCFELAEFALKNNYFTLSLDWLNAAEEDGNSEDLSNYEIKKLKEQIITQHDKNWERNVKSNHKYIFKNKLNSLEDIKLDKVLLDRNKEFLWNKYVGNFTTIRGQQMEYNYIALCKGTKFRTPKDEQSLYCWLDTKKGPYWKINPLKIELLNKDPYLFLIHNVVPDSWTQKLMQMVWENKTNTYEALNKDVLSNISIYKRYELLFNFITQKNFKLNIYAPGALLYPHIDDPQIIVPINTTKSQIILSTVFYINPAEIGGATVFPYIGLSVKGPEGSILVWYNTLRNGEWDRKMIHGGCPTVYGHKMVATTWIFDDVNFLKRPCELDKTK